jgi:hypothetical protein
MDDHRLCAAGGIEAADAVNRGVSRFKCSVSREEKEEATSS